MVVISEDKNIFFRLLQPENAYFPIVVNPEGSSILVRLLQPENAYDLMLFNPVESSLLGCCNQRTYTFQ